MKNRQDIEYATPFKRILGISVDLVIMAFISLPISWFFTNMKFGQKESLVEAVERFYKIALDAGTQASVGSFFSFLSSEGLLVRYVLVNQIGPLIFIALYVLFFFKKFGNTPGKMITRCKVIDEKSLEDITTKQVVLRLVGYFLVFGTLGIGFLIAYFNKQKKMIQDFLAGTVVIVQLHKLPNFLKKTRSNRK